MTTVNRGRSVVIYGNAAVKVTLHGVACDWRRETGNIWSKGAHEAEK